MFDMCMHLLRAIVHIYQSEGCLKDRCAADDASPEVVWVLFECCMQQHHGLFHLVLGSQQQHQKVQRVDVVVVVLQCQLHVGQCLPNLPTEIQQGLKWMHKLCSKTTTDHGKVIIDSHLPRQLQSIVGMTIVLYERNVLHQPV